ncbi:MAG: hypothetical protein CM1200mP39_29380 [Dehalococcoidia bacterium]|nr:MAG: hypothetical protein CM1200mP39_29380 [Dehalococcoidia bacterium]
MKLSLVTHTQNLKTREFFGVLIQYPASTGRLNDPSEAISQAHNKGALAVVASDLLALTQIKSPGEMDADVVVGNSQRFGVPMGYGGPHAAFLQPVRNINDPLRDALLGYQLMLKDARLRMALQTREQHIRREKATSNICTAQVLLAKLLPYMQCIRSRRPQKYR